MDTRLAVRVVDAESVEKHTVNQSFAYSEGLSFRDKVPRPNVENSTSIQCSSRNENKCKVILEVTFVVEISLSRASRISAEIPKEENIWITQSRSRSPSSGWNRYVNTLFSNSERKIHPSSCQQ